MRYLFWALAAFFLYTGIVTVANSITYFLTLPPPQRPHVIFSSVMGILAIGAGFRFRHIGSKYPKPPSRTNDTA